jgi:glycosyltransferase involved in cell wall biosynthesis
MTGVNIVTSDRGWVLEKLAGELAARLPYVAFGEGPDRDAAIQYYMTYSARRRRLSPVELAYFAHLEPDPPTRENFFATARAVEHCVCHSQPYEAMLRAAGVAKVTTIPPGVDLDAFRPRLRIGVIGRTYHTSRKGEHLVAQVMDIPEIEWAFTGEGWPGPALKLPPEALPDFYRSLDYVLVPALYEGGPMCVVEALACGTEVIAPPIGWVPEYPHVEYRAGDAADLRRVLLALVEKKREMRASVLGRGWDAWAEGHDRLFSALAETNGVTLTPRAARHRPGRPRRVGLFLHGSEGVAMGGPSVRAPRLARELTHAGTPAELRMHPAAAGFAGLDLVHAFNTWPPWSAPDLVRRAHAAGRAVVLSPILLDHSLRDHWEERLPRLFAEAGPKGPGETGLAAFRADLAEARASEEPGPEPAPGFHAAVREICALADRLVLLGERERARLARIGAEAGHGRVVLNPVDAALYAEADPALFEQATGLRDFVLCVARFEPRKNQLMLLHALRGTGLPLVLIGHGDNHAYRALLERHRGPDVHILDRLEPNSLLLASACAAARVAVLPSWSEGAPLVALEAGAAGAALVLTDESGAREHLAEISRGCDPGDPASIRAAVLDAWETRRGAEQVAAQKAFIAETFSWDRHRAGTEAVYAEAIAAARARGAAPPLPLPSPPPARDWRGVRIVMDLTTSANHKGRWTGIARVEAALALALAADAQAEIHFVAWNSTARSFVDIPAAALCDGTLEAELARHDADPVPAAAPPEGAHLLVAGSAWMQNALYAESLVAFARACRLRLTALIHDVIPTKFPFWYEEGYAPVFEHNLTLMLDGAEALIAVSEATRRDVECFAARIADLSIPPVALLREGDEIGRLSADEDEIALLRIAGDFADTPFVLAVGAIHHRKNQRLLHDVWLKLVERMGARCPRLVIVGGVAWNGGDVARALAGDARLEGRVHILADVDDEALDWLYANCLFTVYPSLYEGWGLPVAESLRHGKPCLAADVASIPEIAPGLVELLDPLDTTAWVAKVQFYATSRAAREAATARIAEAYLPTSWAQSAGRLIALLEDAAARARPPRPYVPGAVVALADRIAAARFRGPGWHAVEEWGCWAAAARAELRFEPSVPISEDAVFIAETRALCPPGACFEARILAEGVMVARWRLCGGAPTVLHAVIPASIAAHAPRLSVAIETEELVAVREVSNPDDPREVGLGLSRVVLAPLSSVRDAARHLGATGEAPHRLTLGRCHKLLVESQGVLQGGWVARGGWGMTCAEARPLLEFTLPERPGRDLDLLLWLRPVATPDAPLRLRAVVEGEELAAWTFDSDAPVTITLTLPAALRGRADPIALELVPEPARAPKPLGLGAAEEAFGFGLVAIEAREAGTPSRPPRLHLEPGGMLRLDDAHAAGPLGADWHAPEADGTWSFGAMGLLPLRLGATAQGGALLVAEVEVFRAPPGADASLLDASAGERLLTRQALAPGARHSVEIPVPEGACGPDGTLDLLLAVAAAPSPFAVGAGEDERPLGLRLVRLEAAALADTVLERRYDFTVAGDIAELELRGWFDPEPEGRWSQAEGAEIRLRRPRGAGERLRLDFSGRVYGTGLGGPARVDVSLDGALAAFLVFETDAPGRQEVVLDCAGCGAEVVLSLRRPAAVSPAEAGEGEDARKLGLMLRALGVVWA